MSQTFDESPVSDNKMDISESATTSQESAGVSPIGGESLVGEQLTGTATITPTTIVCSDNNQSKLNKTTALLLSSTSDKDDDKLDNDQMTDMKQQYNLNMLKSELTVANSHPLMSPPGTDSDSENGHRRVFNFPDVVPVSEQPLRLANPAVTTTSIPLNSIPDDHKKVSPKTLNVKVMTNSCTKISRETAFEKRQRKITAAVLRAPSPDLLSSGSEQELSQYHASVEPLNQSVALISKNSTRLNGNSSDASATALDKPLIRRKIPMSSDILSDDISSLDSISNHSFDDDIEPNLASISPSSSFMDDFGDDHDEFDDDFCDLETPTNAPSEPIPTYAADEERRDSRNWQKITLPDGRTREIDMRVIEPYKRVLSHGGYLKAGGHNAIVMFCACHLPDRSRADYHYVMDNLFLYVVKTLEQLVTEDYVLVYLHGGSSRRNVPPFPWLKKCYQLLDRRLRKSLSNLYLVHPTFWLKSVVWMLRPFVSSKFWRKLVYVRTLEELYSMVSVEKTSIPEKVKSYDSKCK